MKGRPQLMAVFAVLLTVLPLISLLKGRAPEKPGQPSGDGKVLILLDPGAPTELSMRDYIIGAVAAQMPGDFSPEALKAQAVLAHTYALRRRIEEQKDPTPELCGADLSSDTSLYQAYFTPEQIHTLYGSETESILKKLGAAADYALTRSLTFEGKPIIAAFHAVSPGRTESARDVWGENIPYLVSVESPGDEKEPSCSSEVSFTENELAGKLRASFPELPDKYEHSPAEIVSRTEAGSVSEAEIFGEMRVSGVELAAALGLESAHFELSESDGEYVFKVLGRGHLVGMSQLGAERMAKSGKLCEEILGHYFPGAGLENSETVV